MTLDKFLKNVKISKSIQNNDCGLDVNNINNFITNDQIIVLLQSNMDIDGAGIINNSCKNYFIKMLELSNKVELLSKLKGKKYTIYQQSDSDVDQDIEKIIKFSILINYKDKGRTNFEAVMSWKNNDGRTMITAFDQLIEDVDLALNSAKSININKVQ